MMVVATTVETAISSAAVARRTFRREIIRALPVNCRLRPVQSKLPQDYFCEAAMAWCRSQDVSTSLIPTESRTTSSW